jgi:hypothetical protein
VSVDVIAHYWVKPGEYKSDPFENVDEVDPPLSSNVPNAQAALASDKILAFVFGVVFVGVLLAVGLLHRSPTPLGIFIFRVVLALAAAGVGAVIPGLVSVEIDPFVRAGGAIALFVIVYWFKPADLVAQNTPPQHPAAPPSAQHRKPQR